MEFETKKGYLYINDLCKIYAVEYEESDWGGKEYIVEVTWLTKKADYEETYYDFKEKRFSFKTKDDAIRVYKNIVEKIKKSEQKKEEKN